MSDLDIKSSLREKNVAFLDVLGFKNIVNKPETRINDYFNTVLSIFDETLAKEVEYTLISDSIILTSPPTLDGLKVLISTVQQIQAKCAVLNIWIRGALSYGEIFIDRTRNIVVGKGLSKAYTLEAKAKFPRVILDPSIVTKYFKNRDDMHFILNCYPDQYYVRIKIPLIYEPSPESKIIDDSIFIAFAESIIWEHTESLMPIHDFIKAQLYSEYELYEKYFWLKNYLNEIIFTHFGKQVPSKIRWDLIMSDYNCL